MDKQKKASIELGLGINAEKIDRGRSLHYSLIEATRTYSNNACSWGRRVWKNSQCRKPRSKEQGLKEEIITEKLSRCGGRPESEKGQV